MRRRAATTFVETGLATAWPSLARSPATVEARTVAACPIPRRARKRLESRALAATDAMMCLESFSSAQSAAAAMSDDPTPRRRESRRTCKLPTWTASSSWMGEIGARRTWATPTSTSSSRATSRRSAGSASRRAMARAVCSSVADATSDRSGEAIPFQMATSVAASDARASRTTTDPRATISPVLVTPPSAVLTSSVDAVVRLPLQRRARTRIRPRP